MYVWCWEVMGVISITSTAFSSWFIWCYLINGTIQIVNSFYKSEQIQRPGGILCDHLYIFVVDVWTTLYFVYTCFNILSAQTNRNFEKNQYFELAIFKVYNKKHLYFTRIKLLYSRTVLTTSRWPIGLNPVWIFFNKIPFNCRTYIL